jgi:RNA polymerase sigma factor for flagellar operon FliA
VRAIARQVYYKCGGHVPLEELEQEGWIGLAQARKAWRPDGGASLKTFAGPRVRGRLMDYLRDLDPLSRKHREQIQAGLLPAVRIGSLDRQAPYAGDDDEGEHGRTLADQLGRRHAGFEQLERRDYVRGLLATLRPPRRRLLELYYLEGMTMKEVGVRLGVSESRISQMHTQIMEDLRARLKGRDELWTTESEISGSPRSANGTESS